MTLLEWIARLTQSYLKHTGKNPGNLAKLKIKMEAAQRVKAQQSDPSRYLGWNPKVIEGGKGITGIKRQMSKVEGLSDELAKKQRETETMFPGSEISKNRRAEFLKKYTKDGQPNDVELNALVDEHRILSEEAKKLGDAGEHYEKFQNLNRRTEEIEEILTFMKKEFPEDVFASGGLARVGMFGGGPAKKIWQEFIEKLFIKASNDIRRGKGKWAGLNQEQWITQHDNLTKMIKKWELSGKKGLPEGAEEYLGMNNLQITKAIKDATKKVKSPHSPAIQNKYLEDLDNSIMETMELTKSEMDSMSSTALDDLRRNADPLGMQKNFGEITPGRGVGDFPDDPFKTIDISDPEVASDFTRYIKKTDPQGFKELEQKIQLDSFDPKGRKPNASGGIAGQLHLNRQGYPFGGPVAGSKALKAIMDAFRSNKTWGVGGPPYKPGATTFNVKELTKRLYGTEMSLADMKKMSELPGPGFDKLDFVKFNREFKNIKANVLKEKLLESKIHAQAMIDSAKTVTADNPTAKKVQAQFTREGKKQLEEVREGLKEIEIYMGMLQKKGRKLHASGGIAGQLHLNGGGPVDQQALIQMYIEEGLSYEDAVAAASSLNMDQLKRAEGGRIGYAQGTGRYPGPHQEFKEYEPQFQKTRKPYKSIEDVPPEILAMLMKDPNFDPSVFMDMEWSEPEGAWYNTPVGLRGVYYGHDDPNINLAQVEMGDKPARHPEAEPEDFVRKIHLNLNPFLSDDSPSPRARDWTSNMDRARIASHEARHKAYLEDRELWESQPEWVKKNPKTHEEFNRFMDQRYYPPERMGKDRYFDKILKDLWEPSAKEYERIIKEDPRRRPPREFPSAEDLEEQTAFKLTPEMIEEGWRYPGRSSRGVPHKRTARNKRGYAKGGLAKVLGV